MENLDTDDHSTNVTGGAMKRASSDLLRRGSDSSVGSSSFGVAIVKPSYDVDPEAIRRLSSMYSLNLGHRKQASVSTTASSVWTTGTSNNSGSRRSGAEGVEDDDLLAEVDVPRYLMLGDAPRKGSEGSFRKRSVSLPDNM